MLREKEATMGFAKKLLACCLAVALLPTFALTAYAAGTGTKADPYIGGKEGGYGSADAASIILHKFDVTAFQKKKAEALKTAGQLSDDGTVTYTPGTNPTGANLAGTEVIGTYVTSDNATPQNVTLDEMAALGNITFQLEEVELAANAVPGSADPNDYAAKDKGISDFSKTDANGMISWTGLPNGHYRITEPDNDTGSAVGPNQHIVSVPMVDPADSSLTISTVHLYPKNTTTDGPIVVKEKPKPEDYAGNVLAWTIKAEIPPTLKPSVGDQVYEITDAMGAGLFYKGNASVYYMSANNKVGLEAGVDYLLTATPGGKAMKIALLAPGFAKLGNALQASAIDKDTTGKYILYVTYDTVVNLTEEEVEQNTTPSNEVDLKFVNSDGTTYTDDPPAVTVDSYGALKVYKLDGSDKKTPLQNVTFKIYTELDAGAVKASSVLKDATGADLEFTTDDKGQFFYGGLDEGTYYIVEGAPPTGYKKVEGYTAVTISDTDVAGKKTVEATIYNYRDNTFSLPETGGMGTTIFVVLGGALVVSAGVLYFVSRKRSRDND